MTTLPQSDGYPDQSKISAPIAFKVPVPVQLEVVPTPYGCEMIVPITLKIPIVLQIDVVEVPPLCKSQQSKSSSTAAPSTLTQLAQERIKSPPEPMEPRSEAPPSDPPSTSAELPVTLPVAASAPPGQPQSNQLNLQKLRQLSAKLHYLCPLTILMILLGALLGVGCSFIVVKYLLDLRADQGFAIASIELAKLKLKDSGF